MEEMTLQLTAMAHGGAALGRDENGRVIFVPHGIPGETVRLRVLRDKERFAHAELIELLKISPKRVDARCQHYNLCGGCHYQHIDYQEQLRFKTGIVRDQLSRVGKFDDPPVESALPSPSPWEYRNSVSFSPTEEGLAKGSMLITKVISK